VAGERGGGLPALRGRLLEELGDERVPFPPRGPRQELVGDFAD
jgi:hypothetical protein